jgi:hypothetical protein
MSTFEGYKILVVNAESNDQVPAMAEPLWQWMGCQRRRNSRNEL